MSEAIKTTLEDQVADKARYLNPSHCKPIILPPPTQDQMDYLAMILRASEYDGSYIVGGPKKPVDDGRLPDREAHWLLERNVQPPQYLTDGRDVDPDPWRAMRFKTERAAHDYWRTTQSLFRDQLKPVEHVFIHRK